MKSILFLFLTLLLSTTFLASQNIFDARQSVIMEAVVQENPPQITLTWLLDTLNGGYTIWRKAKDDSSWTDSLTSLNSASTTWTDNNVAMGVGYEYQIIKSLPDFLDEKGNPTFSAGYIYAGIRIEPIHDRGTCLVVIDSTFKQTLESEINRLMSDLESDGWRPYKLYVDRNTPVPAVRASIQNWAAVHHGPNRAVFLLGRVPVPYAGDIAPDGHHNDHKGAWPSDGYYGNLDGWWSDSIININMPGTRNDNFPGDGKFDNRFFPTQVDLQVGRVDFADMSKFPENEEQLLKRYLDKDHAWRIGKMPMIERGLVDNNFNDAEGLGQTGWRNFSTMFGFSKVKDLPYRQTLSTQSYLWSYGCGGGGPESASDISNTTNFTTDSLLTVFTVLFGSYFGDWDYPNNFLRAAIASRTCLTSTWGNRPNWLFHHMAMGETIGHSAQVTMNNIGLYHSSVYGGFVHTALMGDPTLRMHILTPVEDLVASQHQLHVRLDWQDPVNALGYFIYKKGALDTAYYLLNQLPITNKFYIDSCAGEGLINYMVRSVELRSSASGTYYNLSAGSVIPISADPTPWVAQADFVPAIYFDALNVSNTSINSQAYLWDFGDSNQSTVSEPDHLYLSAGDYTLCLQAFDACQSDIHCQLIQVVSSLPDVVPQITDNICHGDSNGIIQLTLTGGAPGLDLEWPGFPDVDPLLEDLAAGDYYCVITSSTGNTATYGPFIINQPAAWIFDEQIVMANAGQSNGAITIDPQGGCLPYSFKWDNGNTTNGIQNLSPGTYCVTVSDCAGCKQEFCGTVKLNSMISNLPGLMGMDIFPNPVVNTLQVDMHFDQVQKVALNLLDVQGKIVGTDVQTGQSIQLVWDVTSLPAGTYFMRATVRERSLLIPFVKTNK